MDNVYAFGRMLTPEEHMQSLVDDAHRAFVQSKTGLNNFPTFFLQLMKERAWEHPRSLDRGTVEPMSFDQFIREDYPRGLGSTFEAVEHMVKSGTHGGHREEALTLWTILTKRSDGGANNPHGIGGKSGKQADDIVTVDNIHGDKAKRPSGTSREAGLRRLAAAAEAGDEAAADNLRAVHEGRKSVHAACVDMGYRAPRIDKDVRDRAATALAERIVANFGADEYADALANANTCGAKALAIALANLIGGSIMDRGGWAP